MFGRWWWTKIDGELGLPLNVSMCKLISHDGFTVTDRLLSLSAGHEFMMSHFLALQFFQARRLIRPVQTDVLSLLGV